jgi:DNA-binding MarR family transcriptional regulator
MSGRLVGEVLKYAPADLTQLEMLVLVSLADSVKNGDRTAKFYASNDHIADRVRSTPASVRNVIAKLVQRGLIVPQIEKCHRGVAQQYEITHMSEATLKATIRW